MSRLTFRPPSQQVRAWVTSFMLLLDLKVGCTVITFFALFNKIAGIFGIIAVFSGGTFAQISLYIYSIATIGLLLWALRGISDEDAGKSLRYAHLFLADHLVSSFWTLHFAMDWYTLQPHDGSKPQLAAHQAGLMDLIEKIENSYELPGSIKHHVPLVGQERVDAAQRVWKEERGFSATVLAAGWVLKVYFALILYSYALHLRHGTYHSLWQSKAVSLASTAGSGHLRMRSRGYQQVPGEAYDLPGGRGGEGAVEELPPWSEEEEEGEKAEEAAAVSDERKGRIPGLKVDPPAQDALALGGAGNARMTRTASSSSTRAT